jgi:hypothetical protein
MLHGSPQSSQRRSAGFTAVSTGVLPPQEQQYSKEIAMGWECTSMENDARFRKADEAAEPSGCPANP